MHPPGMQDNLAYDASNYKVTFFCYSEQRKSKHGSRRLSQQQQEVETSHIHIEAQSDCPVMETAPVHRAVEQFSLVTAKPGRSV